jgi:enoyl-CoA hydratase
MLFENILVTQTDSIAVVTINRPTKLNALNKATLGELHEAFKALSADKNTRAIILAGAGEKAFVAGADIAEFADFSVEQGRELAAKGQETVFDYIQNLTTK